MIWAIKNNERVKAIPKEKAICPLCNQEVISKCGEIKIWHWSHKQNFECDSFKEPETEWHINWKEKFPKEFQEVIVKNHRADIKNKEGKIIEFQNSNLSTKDIRDRERLYDTMIWVLNGQTIAKNIIFFKRAYKWNWFPHSWNFSNKTIYIDKEDSFLYRLTSLGNKGEFIKISKDAFIIEYGGKPWQR